MKIGDIVMANRALRALGLPYLATVEAIKENKIKVRPLHPALIGRRKGPSIRARWLYLHSVQPTGGTL